MLIHSGGSEMKKMLLISALACGLVLAGCKGTGTGEQEPVKYTLFGLAELNLEENKDYLTLEFYADNEPVPGSFVQLGTDTLYFDSAGKIAVSTPVIAWSFDANIAITVFDTSDNFSHTVVARMPGDFTIVDFPYADQPYQNGNIVVQWTLSAGASGFFLTCVQKGDTPLAEGYAEIVTTGLPAAAIPADAFLEYNAALPQRVPDSFYVYVVAYNPTYYPRAGAPYTDTPLFDQLVFPTSIIGQDIGGTFAAAVVSRREPFDVVEQD
jgi:hypothetical protein